MMCIYRGIKSIHREIRTKKKRRNKKKNCVLYAYTFNNTKFKQKKGGKNNAFTHLSFYTGIVMQANKPFKSFFK